MGIRIPHLIFGALVLLCLSVVAPPPMWAQGQAQQRRTGPAGAPIPQGQNPDGMHIYIWSGLKSHGVGQHDYPQFLADWTALLTEHGAVLDGSLHMPSSADLKGVDVMIIYKGDAGFITDEQKAVLEEYVKGGGGIVVFHDSGCGPEPEYFSKFIGGAKKHGEVNYSAGLIHYTVADKNDPIMAEMGDITIDDEAFYRITWAQDPPVHVLATTVIPKRNVAAMPGGFSDRPGADNPGGEVVPQMWKWEHTLPGGQPARAFVWMQGHSMRSFENYQIQQTLLRGIAWAGKKPVNELVDYEPPVRPAIGAGGRAPTTRAPQQ